jgi:predicted amidohydrolase
MKRRIRISAAQLPTVIEGKSFAEKQEKNLNDIVKTLELARKRRSDLVLFGEYANLHHRTWSEDKAEYVADPIPGPFTKTIAECARRFRLNVAMPMFGTYKGALSSHVVLFNRSGKIIGCYQKTHPTVPEQSMGIQPGNEIAVYKLDCVSVGIMTCMDIEYPEVAQILMLRGAELLLFPHVQGGWGEVDWEIRYRARAIDTGLPVLSACYGYPEGEWLPGKMIGRTSLVGRDGLILGDLGRGVGLLTHDLDLDQKRITPFFFNEKHDRTLAVIASRRPELYGELVGEEAKKKALKRLRTESVRRKTSDDMCHTLNRTNITSPSSTT